MMADVDRSRSGKIMTEGFARLLLEVFAPESRLRQEFTTPAALCEAVLATQGRYDAFLAPYLVAEQERAKTFTRRPDAFAEMVRAETSVAYTIHHTVQKNAEVSGWMPHYRPYVINLLDRYAENKALWQAASV